MPDLVTHYHLGAEVFSSLPEPVREKIMRPLYDFTTAGPDVWFSMGFLGQTRKALLVRGSIMHKQKTGEFLRALAEEAKARPESRDLLFSYLAGFLCHYWLDSFCHPYIMTRTGNYSQNDPATLPFRGSHVRFERAVDSSYIRRFYGRTPWHFPFLRQVLTLRRLPEGLRGGLDAAYERVFGWTGCFDALRQGLKDERLFFALMKDPFGLIFRLIRKFDKGLDETDAKQYSYWHKDLTDAEVDVLNEGHRPWRHFRDVSVVSEESFSELFEKSRIYCAASVEGCFAFVYGDAPYPAEQIGRRSYETGFDWDDPRHSNEPVWDDCFANMKK